MWFDCYRIQNRMNLATYTDLGTRLGPLYDRFILFYILVISQTQIGGRSKGMRLETGDSSGVSSYPASRNGDEGEKDEIDGSIRMVEDYIPEIPLPLVHLTGGYQHTIKQSQFARTAHCMLHSQLPGMELVTF